MPDWPRLSETLTGPRHPEHCQSCGEGGDLLRWQECDEQDELTPAVVVLCGPCARRIIDPHPRLYHCLDRNQPHPGSMPLCVACTWRAGTGCQHPDLRTNGGNGLEIRFPKPQRMHVLCSPRPASGWRTIYPGPVTSCAGRRERVAQESEGACGEQVHPRPGRREKP